MGVVLKPSARSSKSSIPESLTLSLEETPTQRLADRRSYIDEQLTRTSVPGTGFHEFAIWNGDDERALILSVSWGLPPKLWRDVGVIQVTFPPESAPAKAQELLAAAGDAAAAFHGDISPLRAAASIKGEISGSPLVYDASAAGPHPGGIGLGLKQRNPAASLAVAPDYIGWISYFSAATARFFDFPNGPRDAEWLAREFTTPTGAWLIRLTDEPLDLTREEHRIRVKLAYQRFGKAWN